MAKLINVDDLTRAAKSYDPLLKTLPFNTLDPVLTNMGINLLEVGDGENIEVTFNRKGGITKPYVATTSDLDAAETEIGQFVEMPLQTKKTYAALKDHIDNYTANKVLNNVGEKVNQQTKQHPLEQLIIENKVIIVGEDLVDAMFHSKFDGSDASPMGISDGFFTLQDNFIVSGDIAAAKKNYHESGALIAPASETDYDAFKNLVAWLREADPSLKKGKVNLYIPGATLLNIKDAAANKFRYINNVDMAILQVLLRDHALMPNLTIKTDACLGTGTRIFLTEEGNMDYGMSTKSDAQFVQIRSPYPDPNWIQFWMQFRVGQRIKSLHRKKFMMNEGTTVSLSLAGDYS